jgi:uncharacterized SAM-binding protein YcdF (DUF218 family)
VARRPVYRFLQFALVLLLVAVLAVFTSPWWLRAFSYALIHEGPPVKADLAVVLGGDYLGRRIEKGGDLVRQGFAQAVLVSGPPGAYGQHECDPEIAYAVRQGYPSSLFIPFPNQARSTQDEAAVIVTELRRRHVRQILLVTSEFHTGRAYRTFQNTTRKLGISIDIHAIGTADPDFQPDSWWRSREGQKITFLEWTKTVAAVLGL